MTLSPFEVVQQLIAGISSETWTDLSRLYAEDAVVEHPYAVDGPSRIEGRAALHSRFSGARERPFKVTAHHVVVRQTDDPEVVVAEYDYRVDVHRTGESFEVANVLIVRVRDGLIVHSRDFHDHHALARAVAA
ncbi:nuclear transport factor 2 family protein [Kibdelosporangium persicum]|uniref:Ketosteroid isomerase n=1 Tax=Kibdelosporangium persicum TaxID=2698649 RepID=A0ABX2F4T4_9PSEU|nr:nuclear transport factor 2 family protein [Kibdelosporangium persicum]NRN65971.1 Ketosteroid isomerase [Kibdelosporangium persicum]